MINTRKNICFLMATSPSNVGDLIINKMLIDKLSEHFNVYVDSYQIPNHFTDIIYRNKKIVDLFTLTRASLKKYNMLKQFFFLLKNDIRIIYKSPGPLNCVYDFHTFIRKLPFSCFLFFLKLIGFKIILVGTDFENNTNFYNRALNGLIISASFCIALRSKFNANFFNNNKVIYTPDCAFGLYRDITFSNVKKRSILLSFRDLGQTDILLEKIDKIVELFSHLDYNICIFYQVVEDEQYASFLYQRYKNYLNVSFKKNIIWYDDINFYADYQLVFSNRLHVLLLGLLYNVLPIPLLSDSSKTLKISRVFDSIGFTSYLNINVNQPFDFSSLLIVDYSDWGKKMVEINRNNYEIFMKVQEEIIDKLSCSKH